VAKVSIDTPIHITADLPYELICHLNFLRETTHCDELEFYLDKDETDWFFDNCYNAIIYLPSEDEEAALELFKTFRVTNV
tara:strand:+ start:289 stop:528 length:240 start_codon:yes stop_codon:yes gene_type:complete